MTDAALYRLDGVTRAYGSEATRVRALDGIDLEIGHGEYVVVSGSSGSGKSTLLQLLGALDRPTAGAVEFEGRDLARLPDRELTELRLRRIGFVFQQFNLIPTLSASENVAAAIAPAARDRRGREDRVSELLERVGLGERGSHLPSQLSGGEQQRVAIARALANEPDVILADEPTGNLDSRNGDSIVDLLAELWAETAVSIVLVTHQPGLAAAAPREIRLADGGVIADEHRLVGDVPARALNG